MSAYRFQRGIRIFICIWVVAGLSGGCALPSSPAATSLLPTATNSSLLPGATPTPEVSPTPLAEVGASPTVAIAEQVPSATPVPLPSVTPTPTREASPTPLVEETPTLTAVVSQVTTATHVLARLPAPGVNSVSSIMWHWRYQSNLAWSPDSIALAYGCEGRGLCLAEAPDFTPKLLVQEANASVQPRWSPDGRQIALGYVHPHPESSEHTIETIAVVRADGSDLRDLLPGDLAVTGTGGAAKTINCWLDNHSLTFMAHRGTEAEELYEIDVVEGTLMPLIAWEAGDLISHTVGAIGVNYHWSPDQGTIAVERGLPGRWPCLLLVDAATGQQTSQSPCPNQWFESWSPDSQRFLYGQWTKPYGATLWDSKPVLHMWEIATGEGYSLLPNGWNAAWSPDGLTIAFILLGEPTYDKNGRIIDTDFEPGQSFTLHVGLVDIDTQKIIALIPYGTTTIRAFEFGKRRPVWSPDGEQVVYWDSNRDLWVMTADGKEQWRLTQNLPVYRAIWSPDSGKLAFTASDYVWVVERLAFDRLHKLK